MVKKDFLIGEQTQCHNVGQELFFKKKPQLILIKKFSIAQKYFS